MARLFFLSPAQCGGSRARRLLAAGTTTPLAYRLRSPQGAPIGDVFAFVSGLYFRGKLTYARRFANPGAVDAAGVGAGVHIITATRGLVPPEHPLTADEMSDFASVDISVENRAFTASLARSAEAIRDRLEAADEVVLLGSIATPKYVDVLLDVFGDRLRFPGAFVGRGDMSRGGLLLRQAASGVELDYQAVRGAVRRGPRPPRLSPEARAAQ